MRKIVFRGFSKHLGEWLYGDLEHVEEGHVRIWPNPDSRDNRADDIAPESVGQYTGLKDSKGVEIYVGDIVKDLDGFREDFGQIAQVKYHVGLCSFTLYYQDGDCIPMNARRRYEIIGNTYENPDLLEGGGDK